jgi:hypothetical protein
MTLEIIREAGELHPLICGRDGNQDRLVKTASQHFHLAILHQHFQELEIFRMMLFDPAEQWARIVKTHTNVRMFLEGLNEWQITTRVRLLENVVEITAGLMRVNDQNHMKLGRQGNEVVSSETA